MSKTRPDWRARLRALAARPSVLSIIVFRSSGKVDSGSGFVIKSDGQAQMSIVLTSHHYLGHVEADDVLRVRRMSPGGVEELPASVIYHDAVADVAILRVPGLTSVSPLHFAPENTFVGQSIVAVGYCDPDDLFAGLAFTRIPIISPGRVTPHGTVNLGRYYGITVFHVILDCVSMHGMSGGPVLSRRGVIGMIDSGTRGITEAVSPQTILQVLKRHLGLGLQDNRTMEQVIDLIA